MLNITSPANIFAMALFLTLLPFSAQAAFVKHDVSAADRAFVAKVSQGGMFEVAAGKLAAERGSTQDIRDLGNSERHDHMLVGRALDAITAHLPVSHKRQLNALFEEDLETLESLSGRDFDLGFIRAMDSIHDKDGAAFAQEAEKGANPQLRAFAQETHRIVERHLGALNALKP